MLDKRLINRICKVLKDGNYFEVSLEAAGVSTSAGYAWLKRGREAKKLDENGQAIPEHEEIFVHFVDAIARASAKAELEAVATVRKGFDADPRVAIEFLKRRYPDRWGDRRKDDGGGASENVNIQQLIVGMVQDIRSQTVNVNEPDEEEV